MSEWDAKTLGDVVDVRVSNVDKKSVDGELPVRLCNYMDVYASDFVSVATPFMRATASKAEIRRFGLLAGDVVITKDSESPDDIAVPTYVAGAGSDVVCGYHLAILRPRDEIDGRFLSYLLQHKSVNRHFARSATGSTRYGLSIGSIKSAPVSIPRSKDEQRHIANLLSSVDEQIQAQQKTIDKMRTLREAFESSELGKLQCNCQSLESLVEKSRPVTYGVVQPGPRPENGVLFVRGGDVFDGELALEELRLISESVSALYKRTQLRGGELLMSLVGYPGQTAIVPAGLAGANIARQVALIAIDKRIANVEFVQTYLLSRPGQASLLGGSVGSAQQVINLKDLRTVKVPIPSMRVQQDIAHAVSSIRSSISNEQRVLAKLKQFKQSLLQELLVVPPSC